ncbi:MAG: acetolactate synthase small subunit [Lutispora sp.]|nr:acetolactate synthase small subunit [Lutispora sp.]MDD4834586.1 acetolactate synthase small subunit [Lutispora sp.]
MSSRVLSILVENRSGVLSKISGLFARRGYNIDSLTVGETEDPHISRMTIVVKDDESIVEQINKQLNKLIDVIKIIELSEQRSVFRELALIKISLNQSNRSVITETVNIFRGNIIDVDNKSIIVEVTGSNDKITAFIELVKPYGIKEMVRTGLTALERGNSK